MDRASKPRKFPPTRQRFEQYRLALTAMTNSSGRRSQMQRRSSPWEAHSGDIADMVESRAERCGATPAIRSERRSPCSRLRPSFRSTAPKRPHQWPDLTEGRLRLDRLCGNGADRLSSPAGCAVIPRETTKSPGCHPPLTLRSQAMPRRSPPARRSPSRPQWCGSKQRSRRTTMATIGTFKKSGNEFTGEIVTLSLQTKNVRIVPESRQVGENAPSHRVFVGRAEIGAAWSDLQRGPRLSRPEAGRSELQRSDLRQPLRRRGRRRLQPHLVPPQPPQRRVGGLNNAPPGHAGRGQALFGRPNQFGLNSPKPAPRGTFLSPYQRRTTILAVVLACAFRSVGGGHA